MSTSFDFDTVRDRRGTHSAKWEMMEPLFGVSAEDGLPMWVADMDFLPPREVNEALARAAEAGFHGYYGNMESYNGAVTGWMARRHGWEIASDWICPCQGVVSSVATCLQAFTEPGDGVILFTPVYHAFHKIISANRREILQCRLDIDQGRYRMNLELLESQLTGRERLVIFCSPHNPAGRIWTADEQRELAEFCAAHELLLLADEIHHDLLMPDETHVMAPLAAPDHLDRIVVQASASKTFSLSGGKSGNAIIPDPRLRERYMAADAARGTQTSRQGIIMTEAAYTHGDAWLDALRIYLDGNRRIFDTGVNAIPGLWSMPMQATYLSWVDFSATGMKPSEFTERVQKIARIAPSPGPAFGTGGESWLRFNLAMPRSQIETAIDRLQDAFRDLQ